MIVVITTKVLMHVCVIVVKSIKVFVLALLPQQQQLRQKLKTYSKGSWPKGYGTDAASLSNCRRIISCRGISNKNGEGNGDYLLRR
jgi:hypothetical protein